MAFDPVSAIFGVAGEVIKRVWPDPTEQAKAAHALAELQQNGDLAFLNADVQIMLGQIETNKIEAQHGGLFKGGWRPFVGWTCGFGLAYNFVLQPFIIALVQIIAHFTGAQLFPIEFLPTLDVGQLIALLVGMLGLGTMRTYEKQQAKT